MIVYLNGQFVAKDEARISPDDRGFLFADGVYEVIRSYEGRLFRTREHLERLLRSLREIGMEASLAGNVGVVAEDLIRRNKLEQGGALVYIQITRGAAPRKHAFPDAGTPCTVYAAASPFAAPEQEQKDGVKIILVPDIRWARCDIKTVALVPNVLASQRAKDNGAREAVFVRDGVVTEGTHTNFCAVFDGTLWTHPKTNHILAGITRDAVLGLCGERGIPVLEAPVFQAHLRKAQELLLVGTTVEVTPVVEVDGWQVGDGKPGPITRKLQRAFSEMVTGWKGAAKRHKKH